MRRKSCNLVKIIYNDLLFDSKMQLFLLFLIIISAISVIWITHQSRYMISHRDELMLKKFSLECEWNDLIFRKNILTHHIRLEKIAIDKLNMRYIDLLLKDV